MINLPWDLIEEILSRVPTKSLARFRSASKQWNALSKSRNFAKKHSANAPKEESMSFMLIDSRVCVLKINLHGFHNNVAPSAKVTYQFELKDPVSNSSQVDIRNVFHCDGLLLCTTRDNRLVVWNPCSGETTWIQPSDSYKASDFYALGYDNSSSCKKYKILRVVRRDEYEIYDFTSGSWRVLGFPDGEFLDFPTGSSFRGVSMKGNSYWIGLDLLLSFDYSTERFQSLPLPYPFSCHSSALSVGREEQLLLLGYIRDLQVWVTTNPRSVTSWSKFLTVRGNNVKDVYWLSFLADEQEETLIYCKCYSNHNKVLNIVGGNQHVEVDPHDRNFETRTYYSHQLLLNYVPSLAQLQQATPLGRRKTQCT